MLRIVFSFLGSRCCFLSYFLVVPEKVVSVRSSESTTIFKETKTSNFEFLHFLRGRRIVVQLEL